MGVVRSNQRLLRNRAVAVLLTAGVLLPGCSSSLPSLSGSLPSWFSRPNRPAAAQANAAGQVRQLDEDCPGVDIRTGAGTLAVAARNDQPTASDLRYQLTFTELARQCFVEGNTVRMRVGVQGRAIVGPAGAPSQISLPIRYAVVREGVSPRTIVTKFRRDTLSLAAGNTTFTDIEEDLSFPLPPQAELVAYVVYVGFDSFSDQQRPPAGKKRAPKR
jgi:hypothetical protein